MGYTYSMWRWRLAGVFMVALNSGCAGTTAQPPGGQAEDTLTLSLPPASLAQWYKPANDRQVWLHTMFRLRRAMQAIEEYSASGDRVAAAKWARRLAEDYRRLPQMVPEWQDEIEPVWVDRLIQATETGQTGDTATALRKLGSTCKSCHNDHRALAAARFRAPNYRSLTVPDSLSGTPRPYHEAMNALSVTVNRMMIALEDRRPAPARQAGLVLERQLKDLGETCGTCHQGTAARDYLLGPKAQRELTDLQRSLEGSNTRDSQQRLGHLSVNVCARCHGIHRTLADLRDRVVPDD